MDYVRTDNRRQQIWKGLSFKGQTETHTIDYNPWSDDNGAVTAVTMTVKSGQAAIANESLASNVQTFTITTSEVGSSTIQVKATAGNNIDITTLYIFTKDPKNYVRDYGICFR